MSVLQVNNVTKSFGKKIVLHTISFQCSTGEILGVFGKNGSGKSTLLKIIFGIVKAGSIEIKINAKSVAPNKIIPFQQIAYLPQHSFLPKEKKVREIIPLFFPKGDDQDIIFYAPKVASFENVKVGELSHGQLRYLELLLIGNLSHPFLMLDEPFSMIEPLYKEVIKELLLKFKETKGIIVTDHYFEDVLEIANRCFLIKDHIKIEVQGKDDLIKYKYLNSR